MELDITGRHIEVTPALKEFAEEKLRKLEKLLDGPLEAHVVLFIEKHRHIAEIQVKSRNAVLSGAHETGDLYASIGEVADKLERQALKHKEKMRHHKQRRGPRDPETAASIAASAEGQPAGRDEAENPPRIVRSESYRLKPLSPVEAALELEETGAELLVFRDADTDRLNVVYRRRNGDFGLVEPVF
jgi:putative sigma-54 modulation protein